MNLGNTIKSIRKKHGFSQRDLAGFCGVTHTYLSQIENNRKRPGPDLMDKIAHRLAVPVPILYFLALDAEDIDPEKAEVFDMLSKPVKAMIQEFFVSPP